MFGGKRFRVIVDRDSGISVIDTYTFDVEKLTYQTLLEYSKYIPFSSDVLQSAQSYEKTERYRALTGGEYAMLSDGEIDPTLPRGAIKGICLDSPKFFKGSHDSDIKRLVYGGLSTMPDLEDVDIVTDEPFGIEQLHGSGNYLTNIKRVTVQGGGYIKYLGSFVFRHCVSLEKIDLSKCRKFHRGCLEYSNFSGAIKADLVEYSAFRMSKVRKADVTNCTSIGDLAFADTPLEECLVGSEVFFGNSCFARTKLREINLHKLKENHVIAEEMFYGCEYLEKVTLEPENAISIKDGAFAGTKSLDIDISSLVRKVQEKRVDINIHEYAFVQSGITTLNIPNWVDGLLLGHCAFADSALQKVILASKGVRARTGVFLGCRKLTEVDLKSTNMVDILGMMFKECSSLKHVEMPVGVRKIASEAFAGCTSLTYLNFTACDSCVIDIDGSAFDGSAIKTIIKRKNQQIRYAKSYKVNIFTDEDMLE